MSEAGNSPGSDAGTPTSEAGYGPIPDPATVPLQPPVIYGPYTKGSGATSPAAQPPVRQPPAAQPPLRSHATELAAQPPSGPPGSAPRQYPPAPSQPPYSMPRAGYPSQPSPAAAPDPADYATWSRRALALLVDDIPALIASAVFFAGYGQFVTALLRSGSAGLPANGRPLMLIGGGGYLVALGWTVYNRWITAGRTGQSLGKRLTRIALVSEITSQPIGAFQAFLRDLVHILDGLAYVGFLWPLWDDKRQTFADKLVRTMVVTAP